MTTHEVLVRSLYTKEIRRINKLKRIHDSMHDKNSIDALKIKKLLDTSNYLVETWRTEIQILGRTNHDNIQL